MVADLQKHQPQSRASAGDGIVLITVTGRELT